MTVSFHDGNNRLYSSYAARAWNDTALLQLNEANTWDKWLIDNYGTEDAVRRLFKGAAVVNIGLGQLAKATQTGLIVLKGLHQWQRIDRSFNYRLHLSYGDDGKIWHANAIYSNSKQTVELTNNITAGDFQTATDHEGFQRVGKKR